MSLASFIRRLLVFGLSLFIPVGILGLSLGWIRGVVLAESFLVIFLVYSMLRSESGILRAYRTLNVAPQGVRRSLERVLARMGGPAPRIHVFNDPSPSALVVRGLGRRGSILISEGLLGILSEEELRELLQACVTRVRGRGIIFQSLCAWLAHLTLKLAPAAWTELLFGELHWHESLSPTGALRFAMALSVAKFFISLGRSDDKAGQYGGRNTPPAFRKLSVVIGEVSNPGSCILHLVDPWASRAIVPLLGS